MSLNIHKENNRCYFGDFNKQNDINPETNKSGVRCYNKFLGAIAEFFKIGFSIKDGDKPPVYLNKTSVKKWLDFHGNKEETLVLKERIQHVVDREKLKKNPDQPQNTSKQASNPVNPPETKQTSAEPTSSPSLGQSYPDEVQSIAAPMLKTIDTLNKLIDKVNPSKNIDKESINLQLEAFDDTHQKYGENLVELKASPENKKAIEETLRNIKTAWLAIKSRLKDPNSPNISKIEVVYPSEQTTPSAKPIPQKPVETKKTSNRPEFQIPEIQKIRDSISSFSDKNKEKVNGILTQFSDLKIEIERQKVGNKEDHEKLILDKENQLKQAIEKFSTTNEDLMNLLKGLLTQVATLKNLYLRNWTLGGRPT